jgi:aminoglycoside phosphotransferase (APT) family kinase protein
MDTDHGGDLPPDVRAWTEGVLGTAVTRASLISGGNRHGTWGLELAAQVDGVGSQVVLRISGSDTDGDEHGPTPLQREAAAYTALHGTEVPLPRLLGATTLDLADLVLVTHVEGDAALPPSGASRDAVLTDLMRRVAALHDIDITTVDLGSLAATGPGPTAGRKAWVQADLAVWEDRYRGTARLDPLIECALAWCQSALPDDDRPAVVVHGDVGPGNFLHNGTAVTGLVDWELAHLGDPLDDLAGFALRTVHASVDGFVALATAYAESAGEPIDPDRLAYHQVLAALRVVILRHRAGGPAQADSAATVADVRQANRMISRVLHRRLLVEALHVATGRLLPPPIATPSIEGSHTGLYEATAALLRDEVLPRTDANGARAVKTAARLVKHLAAVHRLGAVADAAVGEAFRAALGGADPSKGIGKTSSTSVDALRQELAERVRDGGLGTLDALDALFVDAAWETELLRPAMGALADRQLPTLIGSPT